jgi:hypothetical protein
MLLSDGFHSCFTSSELLNANPIPHPPTYFTTLLGGEVISFHICIFKDLFYLLGKQGKTWLLLSGRFLPIKYKSQAHVMKLTNIFK